VGRETFCGWLNQQENQLMLNYVSRAAVTTKPSPIGETGELYVKSRVQHIANVGAEFTA
jgi:hypothetical protein